LHFFIFAKFGCHGDVMCFLKYSGSIFEFVNRENPISPIFFQNLVAMATNQGLNSVGAGIPHLSLKLPHRT